MKHAKAIDITLDSGINISYTKSPKIKYLKNWVNSKNPGPYQQVGF
jgi:hypothetical protein